MHCISWEGGSTVMCAPGLADFYLAIGNKITNYSTIGQDIQAYKHGCSFSRDPKVMKQQFMLQYCMMRFVDK